MQLLNKIINFFKRINYILVAAWVIPAAVLLTILYLNFLPFGYSKTLTIDVGTKNDDKGEFYLENSPALGARQELDGQTFRYLDGLAYAVYEPKVVLKNAIIEASIESDSGVSFILPPDLSQIDWDYNWNYKNILNDFKIETSEKHIFDIFKNSTSTEINSPLGRGVAVIRDGEGSACQENELCYDKGFALELQYTPTRYVQLLNGDISLYQTQKELVLLYRNQKLRYPLPDYYLSDPRTIIIAFDGQNLYLTTDKNENAKSIKIPLLGRGALVLQGGEGNNIPLSGGVGEGSLSLRISKTSSVTSLKFHPETPSLLDTQDASIVLDGSTRLTMPDTADKFEDGPFTVFAEWTPQKAENGQQIIGHYNWEIWQNDKSVSFQVGRMSSSTSPFYKISYPIDETFFNTPHTLLAVYSPIKFPSSGGVGEGSPLLFKEGLGVVNNTINGYIELFVDGIFAGREYFANETIWQEYGNQNLSIGWTPHNYEKNQNFQGNILTIKIARESFSDQFKNQQTFITGGDDIKFPIYGAGDLNKFKINVKK